MWRWLLQKSWLMARFSWWLLPPSLRAQLFGVRAGRDGTAPVVSGALARFGFCGFGFRDARAAGAADAIRIPMWDPAVFAAHRGRIEGPAQQLVMGAGLGALIAQWGGEPVELGILPDDAGAIAAIADNQEQFFGPGDINIDLHRHPRRRCVQCGQSVSN